MRKRDQQYRPLAEPLRWQPGARKWDDPLCWTGVTMILAHPDALSGRARYLLPGPADDPEEALDFLTTILAADAVRLVRRQAGRGAALRNNERRLGSLVGGILGCIQSDNVRGGVRLALEAGMRAQRILDALAKAKAPDPQARSERDRVADAVVAYVRDHPHAKRQAVYAAVGKQCRCGARKVQAAHLDSV